MQGAPREVGRNTTKGLGEEKVPSQIRPQHSCVVPARAA